MGRTDLGAMACPVARTLDVVGEWWTLLIVRDAFVGARRFEEFKATGIADNILSARLKKLVEAAIFERRRYQDHPERFEYHLTQKGQELGLVLAAMAGWGRRWTHGENRRRLTHRGCGHDVSVEARCDTCDRPLKGGEISVERVARDAHAEPAHAAPALAL
jgi:DNA-binding HxlR family transcriptional regulator